MFEAGGSCLPSLDCQVVFDDGLWIEALGEVLGGETAPGFAASVFQRNDGVAAECVKAVLMLEDEGFRSSAGDTDAERLESRVPIGELSLRWDWKGTYGLFGQKFPSHRLVTFVRVNGGYGVKSYVDHEREKFNGFRELRCICVRMFCRIRKRVDLRGLRA